VCTLAVAVGTDRRWPVVVAANRDERLGRASEDWALRGAPARPAYLAPRDAVAGGTWIGLSATGLFAGLTNFHVPTGQGPDPERRSRGEIVPAALAQPTAAAARAALGGLDAAAYNPFHLLVADGHGAFLWWYDGETAAFETLGPGLHVVTERSPYGRDPRGDLLRSRWPVDPAPARLREVLATHSPLPGPCIHLGDVYGTRSAAVLRLAPALALSELYASVGPPCVTPLEDRAALVAALARPGGGPPASPGTPAP
jgi:uncharacterized protein with NRDE domain